MVRYVENLELKISIEHEGHPDLAAQILELETNLRKVVITVARWNQAEEPHYRHSGRGRS